MQEIWISGLIVIALFYFFLILPQQIANRRRRKSLTKLSIGDEIVTIGGLIGRITELDADRVSLEIAPGITVRALRSAISHRLLEGPQATREHKSRKTT